MYSAEQGIPGDETGNESKRCVWKTFLVACKHDQFSLSNSNEENEMANGIGRWRRQTSHFSARACCCRRRRWKANWQLHASPTMARVTLPMAVLTPRVI